MPTIFTHAVVALTASKSCYPEKKTGKKTARFYCIAVIVSCLPDIDVVSFALKIPYHSPMGHRGLTHSLPFAVICGLVATLMVCRGGTKDKMVLLKNWLFFSLLTASHGLLDALTNGGHGIGFFIPLDNSRYFLPWAPIEVSPIGAGFFSARGLMVLWSEILWIWLPCGIVLALVALIRRGQREI